MQETWVQSLCWEEPLEKGRLPTPVFLGLPCGSAGKKSACNAGDLGSIPGLGRSHGEGKGYPLRYSGLEWESQRVGHDWATFTHWVGQNVVWFFFFVTQMNFLAKSILNLFKHTYSPRNPTGQNTECIVFPFSRGFSQPRDWTQVSHIAVGFFTIWATREASKHKKRSTIHLYESLRMRRMRW